MHKTTVTLTIIAAVMLLSATTHAAGVAINETGNNPDSSAMLDVQSSDKGFLPPRMSNVQREAIVAPAVGLTVYQIDGVTGLYIFDGAAWKLVGSGSGGSGTVTSISATTPLTNTGTAADPVIAITGTIADSSLATIATAGKVANSATSAKSTNTASAIVTRDASGNFSAGTITANLVGNADTATTATSALNANTASSATTAGNVTGTVAVANGGTGSTDGSITGTGALAFAAGGTNQNITLTPSGTGNVGIGTATPVSKLHIAGADMNNALLFENTSANPGRNFILFKTEGTEQGYIGLGGGATNHMSVAAYGASNNLFLETGGLARMTVLPSGNVGIGTTTPAYKLDVNGSLNAAGITVNGTPVASSTDTYWSTAGAGKIQYSGGNVGVGVGTPAYKLDVAGDVNVTGNFRINGALLGGTGTVTSIAGSGGTTGLTLSGGPVTTSGTLTLGGTLAVANGGTGTATGSITGTSALTFAAGGTNQNVTITPSGTGYTLLGGNTAIGGTPSASDKLNITDTSTTATSRSLRITKTGTITGDAMGVTAIISGASSWNEALQGIASGTGTNNAGVYALADGASTAANYGTYSRATGGTSYNYGVFGRAEGSVGNTYGGYFTNIATTTGSKYGLVASASGASTGANYGGQFSATNIGGGAAYALVTSVGNVGIGTSTPAYLLDVAGDVNTTGTYRVNGNALGSVALGGTGSTTGSITGTGALTFAAGGTNQNVTITPSGTGYTLLGGNTAIGGTTSATDKLLITDTSTTNLGTGLKINKTGAVTGNSYGAHITVGGGSAWSIGGYAPVTGTGTNNVGFYGSAGTAATNNYGIRGEASTGTGYNYGVYGGASGATGQTYGGFFDNNATSTSAKYGLVARATGISTGSNYGGQFSVSNNTGTPNYGVHTTATTTGTNNYGTYSQATGAGTNNIGGYFTASGATTGNYALITDQGNVGIGTLTPSHKLDVMGELGIGNQTSNYDNTASADFGGLVIQNYKQTGFGITTNIVSTGINTGNWQSEMAFHTRINGGAVTEKMRITNSGNVGIGTTSPDTKLKVVTNVANYTAVISNTLNSTGSMGLLISNGSNSTSGATMVGFYRPDGTMLGSIGQSGATSVAYNTTSDYRLKNNIVDTHFGINDLMKIPVRDYTYKADAANTPTTGFIAQELYEIFPNAVTKPAKEEDMWSVDYGKVTPLLVKGMQDLKAENDELKKENSDLKARLLKIEKALGL